MWSVSSPSAVDVRHDLVDLVPSHREAGERQHEGDVGCAGEDDGACRTGRERVGWMADLGRRQAEDDLPSVGTSGQVIWIARPIKEHENFCQEFCRYLFDSYEISAKFRIHVL